MFLCYPRFDLNALGGRSKLESVKYEELECKLKSRMIW